MCGATRENASSRWTVHWTIGPFLNQMLHLVVKAGKSWKPVRRIFPGQMCENTGSSPPGSTFSYRKTRRSVPASCLIPNCYKYSLHSLPLGWCTRKQLPGEAFTCFQPSPQHVTIHHFCYNNNNSGHVSFLAGLTNIWTSQCDATHLVRNSAHPESQQRPSVMLWSTLGLREAQPASLGCQGSRKRLFCSH